MRRTSPTRSSGTKGLSSVVVSAALGGVLPSPSGTAGDISGYFSGHRDAVLAAALLSLAAVIPLAIFVAVLAARLRLLGIVRGGASLAQTAGTTAVTLAAVAGLGTWVLSRPDTAAAPRAANRPRLRLRDWRPRASFGAAPAHTRRQRDL